MSDFAGLRSGGILDASRWHDRLIWRAEGKRACVNPNSRFIVSYALVSGSLPNLWVMLRFTERAGEGLAGKLLNITQASLVAVSQDAGESEGGFPRMRGIRRGVWRLCGVLVGRDSA